MASDEDIASCIESVLRQTADPAATLSDVVRQVEAKLGVDLSHKSAFIRDQIEILLGPSSLLAATTLVSQQPLPAASPHSPYILLPHLPLQQQIATHQPASSAPSDPFPTQQHSGIAFQYPPPPPLPAAAVMAAYHLQQQLQQTPQGVHAANLPAAAAVAVSAPKESAPPKAKRKGGSGGLNKVCGVSPELQPIVGEAAMSRTQIVKQLWAYIRKNNLQDPNNKRKIICNDELRQVFETDRTDMFKMNKLLAKHILPLGCAKESASEFKRLKAEEVNTPEVSQPDSDGYLLSISDALANFFGCEEREMVQSDALSRVWEYIKSNQLEDHTNMVITCDTKLEELFGCKSFPVTETFWFHQLDLNTYKDGKRTLLRLVVTGCMYAMILESSF